MSLLPTSSFSVSAAAVAAGLPVSTPSSFAVVGSLTTPLYRSSEGDGGAGIKTLKDKTAALAQEALSRETSDEGRAVEIIDRTTISSTREPSYILTKAYKTTRATGEEVFHDVRVFLRKKGTYKTKSYCLSREGKCGIIAFDALTAEGKIAFRALNIKPCEKNEDSSNQSTGVYRVLKNAYIGPYSSASSATVPQDVVLYFSKRKNQLLMKLAGSIRRVFPSNLTAEAQKQYQEIIASFPASSPHAGQKRSARGRFDKDEGRPAGSDAAFSSSAPKRSRTQVALAEAESEDDYSFDEDSVGKDIEEWDGKDASGSEALIPAAKAAETAVPKRSETPDTIPASPH